MFVPITPPIVNVVTHKPSDYEKAQIWAQTPKARSVSWCESRDIPTAVDPAGLHFGKFQFLISTWQSKDVGGKGNPIDWPVGEQNYRAWRLWKADGWSQWQCT